MLSQTASDAVDDHLLARFQAGDAAALETLMELYANDMFALVRSYCPPGILAEDVCQDAWLAAWRSRASFQPGNFRAWIFRIAKNQIVSLARKKRTTQLAENFDVSAEEFDEENPGIEALRQCIAQFKQANDMFISAIVAQMDGASTTEIASMLEIAEGTVGSRLKRGRESLRKCVQQKLA